MNDIAKMVREDARRARQQGSLKKGLTDSGKRDEQLRQAAIAAQS